MNKREAPSGGLSQDRSRRRSTVPTYNLKRLTKTDMVVECLEARPHEAVGLTALHSYLQENIHRLAATSLTWEHDIKAACDIELAKPTSRIAELPPRLPRGPPAYKLRQRHAEAVFLLALPRPPPPHRPPLPPHLLPGRLVFPPFLSLHSSPPVPPRAHTVGFGWRSTLWRSGRAAQSPLRG